MKNKILLTSFAFFFGFSMIAGAQEQDAFVDTTSLIKSAFHLYKDVNETSFSVPTVVQVPFELDTPRQNFAVYDKTTGKFIPYLFREETKVVRVPIKITSSDSEAKESRMDDDNRNTYTEFDLPVNGRGKVAISIMADEPITASRITFSFDENVIPPASVAIYTNDGNGRKVVVARRRMSGRVVQFPKTRAKFWEISLIYDQPLRITELDIEQANAREERFRSIRFLAQPDHTYRIYFASDRAVSPEVGPRGNLRRDQGVVEKSDLLVVENPLFKMSDEDGDGVPNASDNCDYVQNPKQTDVNENSRGDLCDDFDQDSVTNKDDNCVNLPNRRQKDVDGDAIGDVCDEAESRLTEMYPWLPWAGIGFAALVLLSLFALTARSTFTRKKDDEPE